MRHGEEYDYGYPVAPGDYPVSDGSQWPMYTTHPAHSGLQDPHGGGSRSESGYSSAAWVPTSHDSASHAQQYAYGGRQDHQDLPIQPGYNSSVSQQYDDSTSSANRTHHSTEVYLPPSRYPHASSVSSHYSSPSSETHNYRALPATPQSTIDSCLSPIKMSDGRRAYQCAWAGCVKGGEPFRSKDNARVHVHKHFGTDKLFECVLRNCGKTFASEDAAKRHRDTAESKRFSCTICHKEYTRKDYRDVHQRRCTG